MYTNPVNLIFPVNVTFCIILSQNYVENLHVIKFCKVKICGIIR